MKQLIFLSRNGYVQKLMGHGEGREWIALAGLALLGALLRFALIGEKTVWLDEAFSIWIARHGLWEMWSWLVRIDQHPPLYYTLLHGWIGLFGDGQGAVRALSALCSLSAVPLFYAAVRRLIDRPTALIAAFLLAISPFHVRFAQEARMYGLLTLGVAGALYFCASVLDAEAQRRRGVGGVSGFYWWGLAICQAAVMLTHNTAAVYFPLALNLGVVGVLFNAEAQRGKEAKGEFNAEMQRRRDAEGEGNAEARGRGRAGEESGIQSGFLRVSAPLRLRVESLLSTEFARRWLIFQGVALLLWSPWAWPFVVQTLGVDRQFWILPPTLGTVWDTFRNFNFSFLPGDLPLQPLWMALYAGLALWGGLRLRRTPAFWLLAALFLAPIAVALLVSLRRPIFYDRTLIWLTLPYYAFIAAGVRHFPRLPRWRIWPQAGLLGIVLALSGLSLTSYYFWFDKEGWDEAAAYVAENVQPEDLIVFNATWVQIPFEYYYRHYGLETELRGLPVDLFDRGVLEPIMAESDVAYLRQLVEGRPRIWLVYSHDWYTDPGKIIPREMGRALRQVDRRRFTGLQVIRYETH